MHTDEQCALRKSTHDTKYTEAEKFQRSMRKPTRKKHFSLHIAYQLYYQNPDSSLRKAYQRSIYCSDTYAPTEEGTLQTHRCRGRWCPVCASIQTAQMIAGYAPQLAKLDDLWFVTLTRPTVTAEELPEQIKTYQSVWSLMTRQRYWKATKPKGLRKMECTIRPEGRYHYHWHIIIQGEDNARWLIDQWLRRNPDSDRAAQDMRRVDNGGYIELFKYFTKLMAVDKSTGKRYIDFKRLDVIFQAIQGKRVYQPFGGLTKVEEEIDDSKLIATDVPVEFLRLWKWMTGVGYVDYQTGEVLTGDYELPEWVAQLTGGEVTEEQLPEQPR